jgi:murein DD-endopeptidase MepM/ murein hydrolase activator NlpD
MRKLTLFFVLLALVLSTIPHSVSAQSSGPVYIVQSGDTLSYIASRFNVSVDDLMAANPSINPNLLAEGQEIVIPGLEGVTGVLDTEVISLGDSLRSLSRRTQVSEAQLTKLNRMVSPTELYVGISLIIPKQENQTSLNTRATAVNGESLLELAVKQNSDPWTLSSLNNLSGTWDLLPSDVLYSPSGNNEENATGLPSAFQSASISPLPLVQGETEVIKVKTDNNVALSGNLEDKPLHFFQSDTGEQVALQGVHALLEPGVYPLRVEASLPDGTKQSFEQMVVVASGDYPKEALIVSTELIDPAVTKPEDEQVARITEPVTATKFWQGIFNLPVYAPSGEQPCIYDRFGTRRSFNGSAYDYFHAGIDYGVCFQQSPFDIYAAAPGTVVFAGPLTVRGNATFIDHGWGVYSAYFHQKEIYVSVGQQVQAGELIGQIGSTGRVTGPHLHWEVWVNGVQVNPLDWLNQEYP